MYVVIDWFAMCAENYYNYKTAVYQCHWRKKLSLIMIQRMSSQVSTIDMEISSIV